ncbi:MAG: phosphoribosylanthranilate isomerase [Acidobacteriota bacterium]|nr:phosphoribosylanthranilate isomerase [Acidobacteriota bacterium]
MTKVKICGITNLEDALHSIKLGADALGFNFYEKSPRYVTPEDAALIIGRLAPVVLKVGVFVNETVEKIIETSEIAKFDAIQLHGDETPDFCSEVNAGTKLDIIKAFRVTGKFNIEEVLEYNVDAVLLDAYSSNGRGGTGETFNWDIACKVSKICPKLYLAGGLSPQNIAHAIATVRPFAVDACSRLEREKGLKDAQKLKSFFAEVNRDI